MSSFNKTSRRAFLQRMGQLGVAGIAAPWALNLAAMGDAAALDASDYKALVCIFLYGGNDNANTVVPYDNANYALYNSMRGSVALAQSSLSATLLKPDTALANGRQFALHEKLAPLAKLFHDGKLAVQFNVGPLKRPITLDEYRKRQNLPPKLFSHNDQQSIWQSSQPEGSVLGWGGRLGDLSLSVNNGRSNSSTFTCMSLSGNTVFLSGEQALNYSISTGGAIAIADMRYSGSRWICSPGFADLGCHNALQKLITSPRANMFENELVNVLKRSIAAEQTVTAATNLLPTDLVTGFDTDNSSLARQLAQVGKMIASRHELGVKRQVFFVSLGGFDNHDNLNDRHPALLENVGKAMAAFYELTEQLGVANQVTTFTASEFGRTMVGNGDGSDHAWGAEHFIMGGAVRGKAFYGVPAMYEEEAGDNLGQGRFIPTTSVDQYAATLAKWFGVSNAEMPLVVPNLSNFATKDLGFLM